MTTYPQTTTTNTTATAFSPLKLLGQIGFWFLVLLILLFTLFPFYWAFTASLKSYTELTDRATIFPVNPTLVNYEQVLSDNTFQQSLFNSAFVSSISVLIALVVGSFAAYALGRLQFRGRLVMLYLVLAMTMFPQISILTSLFSLAESLGNNLSSLLVTYPLFTLPFTVWTLTTFFRGLPAELEQAALVDGANMFQTFYMILLPLTLPALVTTGLLAFISAWNEYLFALTFTAINPEARTVPVAIALFTGTVQREEPVAQIMTASVIVTVPLIILVLIFQRRIVEGLTSGAVKG
jgi:trehalose/maltose transport system permease protein